MKRVPVNKIFISDDVKFRIRKLFFQQVEMDKITRKVKLTEAVIRRIIKENNWYYGRERYIKYLVNYANIHNIPLIKIANETGVKYYSLCRIRKKYNISKPKRVAWNNTRDDWKEKAIINQYKSGLTGKQIAHTHHYKRKESIYQVLKKHHVRRRPPKIYTYYDESFFEKINSHEKAYILGLIMTDGYIIKDYNGFGIQLTREDEYILEKIRDLIKGTNPITKINYDAKRKIFPNAKDMSRLHVFSRKIANDLKQLGVVKNKTKKLRYNGCVPNKYLNSFFRGLIDGDGSIGFDKRKYMFVTISSASLKFLEDLVKHNIFFDFNLNGTQYYDLRIKGGTKEMIRFCSWIYGNKGDLYLRRKYVKVQDKIG